MLEAGGRGTIGNYALREPRGEVLPIGGFAKRQFLKAGAKRGRHAFAPGSQPNLFSHGIFAVPIARQGSNARGKRRIRIAPSTVKRLRKARVRHSPVANLLVFASTM
ncbi:hypothetical protein WBP07_22165 (plasmid) [Novosphingobium sp. BL-8A]